MKKIICALVAAVLAAALRSCSSSGSSDTLPEIAAGEKADFEVSTPQGKLPRNCRAHQKLHRHCLRLTLKKQKQDFLGSPVFLCLFGYLLK